MKYVKKYRFGGVDSKLTACIELQAPPNTTTEGEVGLLAIDLSSPSHDVYKCVAVNGAVYTWELLSSGMSILYSSERGMFATAGFRYDSINKTDNYVIKVGDLILDSKGYLYSITALKANYCEAKYTDICLNRDGVGIISVEQKSVTDERGVTSNEITLHLTNGEEYTFSTSNGENAYQLAVKRGYNGTEEEWLEHLGYETWLKGKAVTQEEYDALPDDEKYKSGFMYVIKDAEINANSADTLSLEQVMELNCDATGVTVTLPKGVYLVRWVVASGALSGNGLLCADETLTRQDCGYCLENDGAMYVCRVTFYDGYLFRIEHITPGKNTSTIHSGTITLYKIK